MPKPPIHGTFRGADNPTRSRSFEGRFGRMFRNLSGADFGEEAEAEEALRSLGAAMTSDAAASPESEEDPSESKIPAGYTYLGQFIAHDLTFDPVSSLQHDNDPDALVDFRTPRFDLDCLYGRGPADQPYFYEPDNLHFLLGETLQNARGRDVPRTNVDRAIIGDPRNDENVIIAQVHSIFLRFHNRVADLNKGMSFGEVQRLVRWHYQWIVLFDYLRKIVHPRTYDEVLSYDQRGRWNPIVDPPRLRLYRVRNEPYLPIEFSTAAFRFGHSMIRRSYRLNRSDDEGVGGPFEILGNEDPTLDLRGFRRFRRDWGIEWDLFFEGIAPEQHSRVTRNRVQRALKIDTSLSDPMRRLPEAIAGAGRQPIRLLAQRNLIRGWRMGLPSGQTVAHAMGQEPIPDDELLVGPRRIPLLKVSPQFAKNAPLWYYILAEAQHPDHGNQLGPVGGRIVMEVFLGLMMYDGFSFLRQQPIWKPTVGAAGYDFDMAALVKEALT